ncbi:hypothetical protein ADIS_0503 [Lunatimonas lonarensis]|uniref:Lipoprotein n=1 Tax=Lunatimonas lonarensis TaxID=1232681 RepID=R7ZXM4_9BACT|nr:hypothetical protein [Lunatimonas lonarensis]EON78910.1 hypothetical protein ADIS_0503 [Lunatimonas lonarensis]
MKVVCYVLILGMALGCIKGEEELMPDPPLQRVDLYAETTTVKPFEFVPVTTSELVFSEESYKATFKGMEVDLINIMEDNQLLFVVPDVAPGAGELEMVVGNKRALLSFVVVENSVSNPSEVIDKELMAPLLGLQSMITAMVSDPSLPPSMKMQALSSVEMISGLLEEFESLSSVELAEVAKIFQANPLGLSGVFAPSARISMDQEQDCFQMNVGIITASVGVVSMLVAALPKILASGAKAGVLAAFRVKSMLAALGAMIVVSYTTKALVGEAQRKLLNECFFPFETMIQGANGSRNDFSFQNQSEQRFTVINRVKLLSLADIDSPNPYLSNAANNFRLIGIKLKSIIVGVNSVLNRTTSWFYSWFSKPKSEFDLLTDDFEDLPSSPTVKEDVGKSEYISFVDFPADVEVVAVVESDHTVKLQVRAEEETLPRKVTGKVRYDDGVFFHEREVSIDIEAATDIPLLEGYYLVDYAWGEQIILRINVPYFNYSLGDVLYFDPGKNEWNDPVGFRATVFASYMDGEDGATEINVSISTGGCLSESFRIYRLDPSKKSFTGKYEHGRCNHDAYLGSEVSLIYLGESFP